MTSALAAELAARLDEGASALIAVIEPIGEAGWRHAAGTGVGVDPERAVYCAVYAEHPDADLPDR